MRTKYTHVRERTTLGLKGTVSVCKAQLDFPSTLAIAWARRWLCVGPAAMDIDPLPSGVIRRALQVYIEHLEDPATDPRQEARAVRSAANARTFDPDTREGALERLQAHIAGQPMPTYLRTLDGPQAPGALDVDALNAKAETLYQTIAASPYGRLRGLQRDTQEE